MNVILLLQFLFYLLMILVAHVFKFVHLNDGLIFPYLLAFKIALLISSETTLIRHVLKIVHHHLANMVILYLIIALANVQMDIIQQQ